MQNNSTLSYRFLPATVTASDTVSMEGHIFRTFSHFLRESIFNNPATIKEATLIKQVPCINDTGIKICGTYFEHVQQIYIRTQLNKTLVTGSVILAINDCHAKQLRFFKGLWDHDQSDITVWCELMPDIAKQEIAYLETITE